MQLALASTRRPPHLRPRTRTPPLISAERSPPTFRPLPSESVRRQVPKPAAILTWGPGKRPAGSFDVPIDEAAEKVCGGRIECGVKARGPLSWTKDRRPFRPGREGPSLLSAHAARSAHTGSTLICVVLPATPRSFFFKGRVRAQQLEPGRWLITPRVCWRGCSPRLSSTSCTD